MSDTNGARLSIRLRPELDARLAERARLQNVTKSKLVNDLLQQALAPTPNAYELLQRIRVQYDIKVGSGDASENVSAKVKAKLRRKHARALRAR